MATNPTLKLVKKLERNNAEIRFKPRAKSLNSVYSVVGELEDKYPDLVPNNNQSNDIGLFNKDKKRTLRIKYDLFYFSSEADVDNLNDFKSDFKILNEKLVLEPKVENIRHVGFRKVMVLETELAYSELLDIHFEHFYSSSNQLREISSEKIIDTAFALDGEINGIKNRVRISPMIKDEAIASFATNFKVETDDFKSQAYIFLDIDTFYEDGVVNAKDTLESLEKVIEENKRIVSSYLSYFSNINLPEE